MAFWSKKKNKEPSFRSWDLPGEIGTVSLPDFLAVEMEDEQTLRASLTDNLVILRFSSVSLTKKGEDVEQIAKSYVCKKAAEDQHHYYEVAEKGIASYEKHSEQDGLPLVIKYWNVGARGSVVIVSAMIVGNRLAERRVQNLLKLMSQIVESITITKTHKTAIYEGQEVPITEQTVEPFEQTEAPFGPRDQEWLEDSRRFAASLGMKYGSGGALTPEELDVVFARWTFDEEEKEAGEPVANALGAAFGDYLVEQHGFEWIVVTDQYGTDYAVRHPIGGTTAFPTSSVLKRIETNEPECFQNLRVGILDVLRRQMELNAKLQ